MTSRRTPQPPPGSLGADLLRAADAAREVSRPTSHPQGGRPRGYAIHDHAYRVAAREEDDDGAGDAA